MSDLFDKGAQIAAKASNLIYDTPHGFTVEQFSDIAGELDRYTDLPTRADFQPTIDKVKAALDRVSYNGTDGINHQAFIPNVTFANMARVASDVDNWHGDAAKSFVDNYQAPFPFVVQAQFVATSVLMGAIEAEIGLWERAHNDIHDIANKTLNALEAAEDKGGTEFTFAMTVVAAVASVAAIIISEGAAAEVALTVVAGVASSAGDAEGIARSADSPEQVISAMRDALRTLNSTITEKETQIQNALTDMNGALTSSPTTFRLTPPTLASAPGGFGEDLG